MESEVKEKLEVGKGKKPGTTAIAITGIPMWVHKRVKSFQTKLIGERGKKVTLKEAYVEFLKVAAENSKA
jgi:hypothetical protein